MKKGFGLVAAVLAVWALGGVSADAACQNPVPGRYLVSAPANARASVAATVSRLGGAVEAELTHVGLTIVKGDEKVAQALRGTARFVEQDCADWRALGGPDEQQVVPWGIDNVKAATAWATTRGEGVKVFVLDTGGSADHEDLSYAGGKNFSGGNPSDWTDRAGHGTHVSGTIAALDNSIGVVGVAPDVQLYMGKVLGDNGTGSSTGIANGIDWAVSQGADIISMSLGSSSPSPAIQQACDAAWAAGVLVIAASGNDGAGSVSYPAGFDSVVAVGAIDEAEALADFSNYGSAQEVVAPGVGVLSTVPSGLASAASGTVQATGAELTLYPMAYSGQGTVTGGLYNCGKALSASDCPAGVSGNIALVERGDISFADKATNAMSAGAAAVIIYNNAAGDFQGTLGSEGNWVPVVSSSQAQGQDLVALGDGAQVSMSVTPSNYDTYSGTSMATPHVAGVAALVFGANPSLTNQQVRDILSNTARDLGTPGWDSKFGNGAVDAAAAVAAAN